MKVTITVCGDAAAAGLAGKLDIHHDCLQYGTEAVNPVRPSQTWGAILERILTDWVEGGVAVTTAAGQGKTAAATAEALSSGASSRSADRSLVMLGSEDAMAGTEAGAFRQALERIIDQCTREKAGVILMTPPPISERMTAQGQALADLRRLQGRLSDLAQAVRRLAEARNLPLIDVNEFFLRNRLAYDHLCEGWLPDGVAQSGLASFVAGELLEILGVAGYPRPELTDFRKAYSDATQELTKHSGFTDLTRFQGEFYLAFRAGARHGFRGLLGGKTVVLRSADGEHWVREAELRAEGFNETRDPKFLQVGDRLLVYAVCHNPDIKPPAMSVETRGFERMAPGQWSESFACSPSVFWRPKRWREQCVVADYCWEFDDEMQRHFGVRLCRSSDARSWHVVGSILDHDSGANETDLLVDGDQLVAFSRAEAERDNEMQVSTYLPSEDRWATESSGRIIHAPCVFKSGDHVMLSGRYCSQSDERFRELREDWATFTHYDIEESTGTGYQTIAEAAGVDPARIEEYHHGLRTGVFQMDGARPRLVMELLSAGDSSYTGVVEYGGEFVMSDYSMHEYYPQIQRPGDWETPCDIYVSRIRFG